MLNCFRLSRCNKLCHESIQFFLRNTWVPQTNSQLLPSGLREYSHLGGTEGEMSEMTRHVDDSRAARRHQKRPHRSHHILESEVFCPDDGSSLTTQLFPVRFLVHAGMSMRECSVPCVCPLYPGGCTGSWRTRSRSGPSWQC